MCGIAGIIRFDGQAVDPKRLKAMHAHIKYRGPDGEGTFHDHIPLADGTAVDATLLHARLSILDRVGGSQPMRSTPPDVDDPNLVVVVFNGCIYNHQSLRRELQAAGHQFQSDHSDTEVIVRGYQEWGPEKLPEHLEGMYAIALWDRRLRSITFIRDRAGEKPVYVWVHRNDKDGRVVEVSFASSVSALLAGASESPPQPSLHPWFFNLLWQGYCMPNFLPFHDMHLIEPGCVVTIDELLSSPIDPRPYWNTSGSPQEGTPELFDELLRTAVLSRLESDEPLGCFLSGGIDSALIAKYAHEAIPDLRTFCVRMPDQRFDESTEAQQTAQFIGTNHTTLDTATDPATDLVHLIEQLGLPFADSSILPTYWVSKAARNEVKVALSGDGGDELFLGYERHLAAGWLQKRRHWLRLIPEWPLNRFHPRTRMHKASRLGSAARGAGMNDLAPFFSTRRLSKLLTNFKFRSDGDFGGTLQVAGEIFGNYLPNDILCKVDTASMAVALEVRAPFLEQNLMENVMRTPVHTMIQGNVRKGMLKKVARMHFDSMMVDRPKRGFSIPIGEWFRDDYGGLGTLLQDALHSTEPFGPIPIRLDRARAMLNSHMRGSVDHGHRLFALLTLAIWTHYVQDLRSAHA